MIVDRSESLRSTSPAADTDIHTPVLNREGICPHALEIGTDRTLYGVNRRQDSHQCHNTDGDNQCRQGGPQALTADALTGDFDVFGKFQVRSRKVKSKK